MRAVLLFSAALHLAALGLLAAFVMRNWIDKRRPKEFATTEMATIALGLAVCVALPTTVFMSLARPFGTSITAGLVAGLLTALSFILCFSAWPQAPSHGGPPSQASRITAGAFVGVFLLAELIAFCFLAAAAGTVPTHA